MRCRRWLMQTGGWMLLIAMMAPPVGADMTTEERPVSAAESGRFQFPNEYAGEAVLDTTTGLIWEKTPSSGESGWYRAKTECGVKVIGGHRGWRLPSFFELMTLVDPAASIWRGAPKLPAGHPFGRMPVDTYWSADVPQGNPAHAYVVDFSAGDVATRAKIQPSGFWCMKGSPLHRMIQDEPIRLIRLFRSPRPAAMPYDLR